MLSSFETPKGTKVAFGNQRIKSIGQDVKNISGDTKAVVVTDPGVIEVGLADVVLKALKNEGIEVKLFDNVQSDPTSKSVDEAAAIIKASGTKCVIGLGGGSPMDVAKLASVIAGGNEPAEHYELCKNPFPEKIVKYIAIPTTSGTGSEVTRSGIMTNSAGHKVWLWDEEKTAAELAILEPGFTVALPPHLTAATGMDALVHAIEACISKYSNPVIQAMGLHSIRMIAGNLEKVVAKPNDLESRGNMAIASTLAGMAFNQAGTCLAHSIGHALGSLGHIHHGRAVAISLNVIYAFNVKAAVSIHAGIARALGIKDAGQDEKELAMAGAGEFDRLAKVTGINVSLSDDGLTETDCDKFVELILAPENKPMRETNPYWATNEDLRKFALEILKQ